MKIQPGTGHIFTSSSEGFSIDTSEQFPKSDVFDECYPFKIRMAGTSGSNYLFSCCPGTVNSLIPLIGASTTSITDRLDQNPTPTTTLNFDSNGYSYIHLKVSADYSDDIVTFPVPTVTDILYPRVISNSAQQFATVDSVFLLIATIFKDESGGITINQFVDGSMWCDRIQVGSVEAVPNYFFARA